MRVGKNWKITPVFTALSRGYNLIGGGAGNGRSARGQVLEPVAHSRACRGARAEEASWADSCLADQALHWFQEETEFAIAIDYATIRRHHSVETPVRCLCCTFIPYALAFAFLDWQGFCYSFGNVHMIQREGKEHDLHARREDVGGGDGSSCDDSDDASENRPPVASLAAAAPPADSGDAEGGEHRAVPNRSRNPIIYIPQRSTIQRVLLWKTVVFLANSEIALVMKVNNRFNKRI